jgi:hypothetical protein
VIARREHHTVFLITMTVFVLITAVAISCCAYSMNQSITNDDRCAAINGPGYHWDKKDLCTPPPIHTKGLM